MNSRAQLGPMSTRGAGVQSVARAVTILERLAVAGPQSVREVAEATGLHRTTVYRLLRALVEAGWVVRFVPDGAYTLSARFHLVMRTPRIEGAMASRLQPLLDLVCSDLGETVQLAILDGDEIVHVAKCESKDRTGIASHIGQRAQLYNTALGKAILFSLPDAVRVSYMENHFPGDQTGLRSRLEREHALFLSDGYTVDNEESFQGVRCVAVSLDAVGFPLAAVSVTAPANRLEPERMPYVAERLKVAFGLPTRGDRTAGERPTARSGPRRRGTIESPSVSTR